MSKVAHCRQMNPVVRVAEAVIERCRRQRRSFSQVTQAESNEVDWKRPRFCSGGGKRRAEGKHLCRSNREEVERENTDVLLKKKRIVRHKTQSKVAFSGVV